MGDGGEEERADRFQSEVWIHTLRSLPFPVCEALDQEWNLLSLSFPTWKMVTVTVHYATEIGFMWTVLEIPLGRHLVYSPLD